MTCRTMIDNGLVNVPLRRGCLNTTVCLVLLLALTVATTGCKAPGPTGAIPHGTWTGEGLYVYAGWESDQPKADGTMSTLLRGRYPTTLTIQPSTLDGREVVLIEIESNRDALPGLGDRTHARIALEEVQRFCDNTVVYRFVAGAFNEPADKPLEYDATGPPASAVCTTNGDETLLQIHYGDDFIDTLEFDDDEVTKAGMYFNEGKVLVQWWEELQKPGR